ncbi:hypothetical protein C8J57DRAFT_614548 [Mycena rebaudengoi]|nr:hypothetical protein C8J57DRAFT_614548 [Mycena rebaudengoi]
MREAPKIQGMTPHARAHLFRVADKLRDWRMPFFFTSLSYIHALRLPFYFFGVVDPYYLPVSAGFSLSLVKFFKVFNCLSIFICIPSTSSCLLNIITIIFLAHYSLIYFICRY